MLTGDLGSFLLLQRMLLSPSKSPFPSPTKTTDLIKLNGRTHFNMTHCNIDLHIFAVKSCPYESKIGETIFNVRDFVLHQTGFHLVAGNSAPQLPLYYPFAMEKLDLLPELLNLQSWGFCL